MKHRKFLKNSQRGASALEVIFAMGLVVAVTPFIYNQVSEMTHVVHDVSVANQITGTRDAVLNFMRTNQTEFQNESNEISDTSLAAIAPGAVKGMVYQIGVENSTIKNLETYLLFNVDDTKYRASSIAKYIGGDAAVVGDDNRAYAKDWAVQLPESWADVLNSSDNHLVYRIARDFGGDDKTLYLHRGDLGDHLNQMQRVLHMAGFDLVNVADFYAVALNMNSVNAPFVKADDSITAAEVQFTKGATINNGSLDLHTLTGISGNGFQGGITVGQLCTDSERCNLTFYNVNTPSIVITSGGLTADGTATAHIKGFDLPGDLRVQNLAVDVVTMSKDLILFVSNEGDGAELRERFVLNLGDWTYTNVRTENLLPMGPKLNEIKLDAATALNDGDLANSKDFDPYRGPHRININWDKVMDGCFTDESYPLYGCSGWGL